MTTSQTPTLLDLLADRSLSLTDIARTLHLDPAILISQLNDPSRGIPPLLAAERARTQLLATQNLADTLNTLNLAAQHISSFIHSLLPPALSAVEGPARQAPSIVDLSAVEGPDTPSSSPPQHSVLGTQHFSSEHHSVVHDGCQGSARPAGTAPPLESDSSTLHTPTSHTSSENEPRERSDAAENNCILQQTASPSASPSFTSGPPHSATSPLCHSATSPSDSSSPSALNTQHSVLLLRSTDTLRRCAMLFERIATPRAFRERAGSMTSSTSSTTFTHQPNQHPHAFAARPANVPSPSFDQHPAEHPAIAPKYSTLKAGTSYLYSPKTRNWNAWDLRERPNIPASPHSLSYRSATHYHWASLSQGWWIHTPFDRPTDPPLEFPHHSDPDYNRIAQPRPAPANIYRAAPHIPPSFLTAPTTDTSSTDLAPTERQDVATGKVGGQVGRHSDQPQPVERNPLSPSTPSSHPASEKEPREHSDAAEDICHHAEIRTQHSASSSSDPDARCPVPALSAVEGPDALSVSVHPDAPRLAGPVPFAPDTYQPRRGDQVGHILAQLGFERAAQHDDERTAAENAHDDAVTPPRDIHRAPPY